MKACKWLAVIVTMALAVPAVAAQPAPSAPLVPFASLPLRSEPSLAARLVAMRRLTDLPPEGVVVNVVCELRAMGSAGDCAVDDAAAVSPERAQAATTIAWSYRFQAYARRPDFAIVARTVIPVRLAFPPGVSPADIPTQFPDPSALEWGIRPTGEDLSRYYPDRAMRMNIEANVMAACKIADDLSLLCLRFTVEPADQEDIFAEATAKALSRARVAPVFKDGQPAAGRWIKVPVRYRLPHDAPAPLPPTTPP